MTSTNAVSVLIVEDDELLAALLARELCLRGLAAVAVITFYDALELLESGSTRFDVLVTDINLDRGNGVALARLARRHLPKIRTVYITGAEVNPGDVDGPWLKKPVSVDDLLVAIGKVMSKA